MKARTWRVPSQSNPGSEHVVMYTPGMLEEWTCDCEGFRFRNDCSHIQRCKNRLFTLQHAPGLFEPEQLGEDF